MEKGSCNGNTIRAYFDRQTGRCHMFSYSGCNGNRNNFPTEQDCYYICGNLESEFNCDSLLFDDASVVITEVPRDAHRSIKLFPAPIHKFHSAWALLVIVLLIRENARDVRSL
jgi:hypothetical protein